MTTLQSTLQANSGKAKELFDKLAQTSDQAVKTRETLFADLARELRLHAELEQKHLFPALRGNDKTKELVPEAARTNKELRGKIDELEALPKGDGAFQPRLGELRKLFQQQLRDERQELVPAVKQQLGEDKAQAVASRIEATREAAEDEQRAEAEARRAEARREAETRKAAESGKDAVAAVGEAARLNARELGRSAAEAVDSGKHKAADAVDAGRKKAADAVDAGRKKAADAVDTTRQKAADAVDAGKQKAAELRETAKDASGKAVAAARNAAERVRDEARRAKDGAAETVDAFRETARERGADVKAVGSALRNFGKVGGELRTVVAGSIKRTGRDTLAMGKRIVRNPREFGKAQRAYAAAATRNLMESTDQILLIVRSASGAARQPITQRLSATS